MKHNLDECCCVECCYYRNNMKKCKLHPKYKAIRPPVKTTKHPEGCQVCKEIYQQKLNDGCDG